MSRRTWRRRPSLRRGGHARYARDATASWCAEIRTPLYLAAHLAVARMMHRPWLTLTRTLSPTLTLTLTLSPTLTLTLTLSLTLTLTLTLTKQCGLGGLLPSFDEYERLNFASLPGSPLRWRPSSGRTPASSPDQGGRERLGGWREPPTSLEPSLEQHAMAEARDHQGRSRGRRSTKRRSLSPPSPSSSSPITLTLALALALALALIDHRSPITDHPITLTLTAGPPGVAEALHQTRGRSATLLTRPAAPRAEIVPDRLPNRPPKPQPRPSPRSLAAPDRALGITEACEVRDRTSPPASIWQATTDLWGCRL